MHRIALLFIAIVTTACGKSAAPPPPGGAAPVAHAGPAASAPLAAASAADLAREIADADRLGTWSGLASRWQGQRVRWSVTRYRVLCAAADDCHVAAFPIQRPAQQGWMPELAFAPGQYEALARQCAGDEPCEVTIEATLTRLTVSPALATSVRLSDVRIAPGARRT